MKIILMPSDYNQSTSTNEKKMRSKNGELAKSTCILLAKHLLNR